MVRFCLSLHGMQGQSRRIRGICFRHLVTLTLLGWASLGIIQQAFASEALEWTLNQDKSSIHWVATQNNSPVKGGFSNFTAEIRFHPDALANSYAKVTIDANSITTGYDEAESTLKTAEWFNVTDFPNAVFETQSFEALPEENRFRAAARLVIKDEVIPVTLDFLLHHMHETEAHIIGETTLSRTDFGIGWGDTGQVADEVLVKIEIKANR